MGRKLNHSRYIDNGAKRIGDRSYHRAKETPTARQVKFYKKLYATCKEHGIDPKTGEYTRTRMDYARAIDKLIDRLKEHGIDVTCVKMCGTPCDGCFDNKYNGFVWKGVD